jgi:mersacidin/lichenicidin family type 2 lantibiotic
MSVNIVRAWNDPEYRNSLTVGQLASVPANPVSAGELSEEELLGIAGGGIRPVCGYRDEITRAF